MVEPDWSPNPTPTRAIHNIREMTQQKRIWILWSTQTHPRKQSDTVCTCRRRRRQGQDEERKSQKSPMDRTCRSKKSLGEHPAWACRFRLFDASFPWSSSVHVIVFEPVVAMKPERQARPGKVIRLFEIITLQWVLRPSFSVRLWVAVRGWCVAIHLRRQW